MEPRKFPRKNQERAESTQVALISAARRLFIERGYAATGTPDIVTAAAVTRGALYHHYKDKAALFLAVAQQMAQEVAVAVEDGSHPSATATDALLAGSMAYFQAMAQDGRAKLLLIEAPAVLSAKDLQELSDMAGADALKQGLEALLSTESKSAIISNDELDALTQLISATFDRIAKALAHGEDIAPYEAALRNILSGIRSAYVT